MRRGGAKKNNLEGTETPIHAGVLPSVSVVIPVCDEKETLQALCDRSRKALEGMGCTWEIVFVDDGSTDGSEALLRSLFEADRRVQVLFLARNFGQHAALCAGFEQARGAVVVIMDGDLQLCPEDIPRLVNKVWEGYDLVGGRRIRRMDSSLKRKLPSFLFNLILSGSTGVRLHDFNCGFKAMNQGIAESVGLQGERRRYLAPLLVELADRVTEIPVTHSPRTAGKSKYTPARSLALIMDFLKLTVRGTLRPTVSPAGPLRGSLHFAYKAIIRSGGQGSQSPLFVVREKLSHNRISDMSEGEELAVSC